jgi:hypothetical protein
MACALLGESLGFDRRRSNRTRRKNMDAFKCGHCGRKFNSQEELQQHEKECVPARVK